MPGKETSLELSLKPLLNQWSKLACKDYIHDLAWSQNGEHIATADASGYLTVHSATTGQPVELWPAHSLDALRVDYSSDGKFLASSGQDGKAHIYEVSSYKKAGTIDHDTAWVEHIAWHQSGDCILTAAGKQLKLSATDGKLIRQFEDHQSTIADISWNPAAPDLFATSSYNGARLWTLKQTSHKRFFYWKGSLLNIAYSPNGKVLAAGCQDGAAHIWLLPSGEDLLMNGYPTKVRELSWDSTSRYLATGGGNEVIVWDFSGTGPSGSKPVVFPGHQTFISVLAFAPEGTKLASGGKDGAVIIWDLANQTEVMVSKEEDCQVSNLAWSADGTMLAATFASGRISVFCVN
ncbi:MAG: hypothetical protein GC193_10690 [Cryomorphaceae bacterium]|nr:hypothetical protein [Cryomorphaceae bacterium]